MWGTEGPIVFQGFYFWKSNEGEGGLKVDLIEERDMSIRCEISRRVGGGGGRGEGRV
jgi:hypothetical protein